MSRLRARFGSTDEGGSAIAEFVRIALVAFLPLGTASDLATGRIPLLPGFVDANTATGQCVVTRDSYVYG